MRSAILAFVLLSCILPLSGASALIFGIDNRMTVSTDPGSLYSPVGIVYGAPETEYATAFLIDDCHALTVQHVFGEHDSAKGRHIMFAAKVDGPPQSWKTTWAQVEADGGIGANPGAADRVNDWALLRLKKCLGKTFGHVRLSGRIPAPSEVIGVAGYPGDTPLSQGASVDLGCHVRRIRSLTILHDCATLPGSSGAPLFRIVREDGRAVIEVFAMVEAAHSAVDVGRNVMEARNNYPDGVWNVASVLCGNASLMAAGLKCA